MAVLRTTQQIKLRLLCCLCAVACPSAALAQGPVAVAAEFLFYGDNTEYANPFRRGETLLGNSVQLVLGAEMGRIARLRGGVFGDRRFGSEAAFNVVRPVFTVEFDAGSSRFTFGTLALARQPAFGPDRGGPHRLLPAIQRETLSFTRGSEAGLQWTLNTPRVKHDAWINWQRLNTPSGREIFDGGVAGQAALWKRVALGDQWPIVHHGGQLYSTGLVADSWVAAPGAILTTESSGHVKTTLEAFGLVSRYVPNREQMEAATTGAALFTRGAIEHGPWRGHLIVWRGNDYIKEEGDPNYGGLRRDGRRYRKVRDYAEVGITRVASPVPPLQLEASARLHRVEAHYEYSYRILAHVTLRWPLHK
jgi:hypothetical protein